ncbi:PREDICTED: TNF receptor-associated factor 5 [Dinoponera quadriceps]|uniref:TNF receptor-associated factor 5 n=1 Tax=Dinoponera quadriceps TaxID=609295 RepID=A0A6P3YDF0_DINQU|nr:PREDICTED: TNF receptor-associated factor 5 [Dinoponera quadriceps]
MSEHVHTIVRRSVSCYFCNEFLEERHLSEHMAQCSSVLEECPNKCGVYVPRRHLESHRKSCGRRMSRKSCLEDSVWKEKVFSVLTLLRLAIDYGEKERAHLRDALSRNSHLLHSQQESLAALRSDVGMVVEKTRAGVALLNQRLDDLEIITDDAQHRSSASFRQISEQLKLFELADERSRRQDDRLGELRELRTFVAKEGVRVGDMWQEQTQRINDLKLELEMRCRDSKELTAKHDALSRNVDDLLEEIRKQAESTARQKSDLKGLKFQMRQNLKYMEELIAESSPGAEFPEANSCACSEERLFPASTNGRLIWRVDGYREKMNAAKEKNSAIHSPVFLDREYGYTLRMELFLNGKGQWKDRHIIGCLRVESGKWDPLLDWPCVLRASVVLRDQENPANDLRKSVKTVGRDDTDDPDRKSDLYMFIPHTTLSRYPGYTKSDVMFFDVQVRDVKTSASTVSVVQ